MYKYEVEAMTDKHMILFAAAAILLTGCKSNEERLLEQLSDNETYQTYISLKEDGRLDENGYYNIYGEEAIPAMAAVQKQTGITFAENNRFSENVYYLDPEMTIPADDDCRLDKGECIYARIPEVSAEFSDSYKFNGYRICEWKDGVKNGQGTMIWPDGRVYEGQWKNDNINGQGKLTDTDGTVYEGDWVDGGLVKQK